MAEEVEAPQEAPPASSGGGVGKILAVAGILLVAAIAGLTTYLFVIAPRLEDSEKVAEEEEQVEYIPATPFTIEFPQTAVNVIRDGEAPASTLLFGVTLECENQATQSLIEQHRARFLDTINKLHDSRTRSELDDVLLIKESIQRQALQKSNDILQRVQADPDETIRITAVFHHTFVVQDSL